MKNMSGSKREVSSGDDGSNEDSCSDWEDGLGRCAAPEDCSRKSLPNTKFCHDHILMDPKQQLYRPCTKIIARAKNDASIRCGKTATRSPYPALCDAHIEEARLARIQDSDNQEKAEQPKKTDASLKEGKPPMTR